MSTSEAVTDVTSAKVEEDQGTVVHVTAGPFVASFTILCVTAMICLTYLVAQSPEALHALAQIMTPPRSRQLP